jgi:cytochrome bd-type quinol oxidase subunit 1
LDQHCSLFAKTTPVHDMIYLLTTIGLPPGGSSTVHIYTQTIHRKTQNKQYIEPHKRFVRVRAVLRLCGLYSGICFTTEEKARKNLSVDGN